MELKLGKIASVLTLIAAWAYSLGWIKTFYYYNTFGIGTESLDLTPQDYLFASWYTVETLVFFVLLLWVVAVSRRLWPWLFVLAYLPIPFFGEWIMDIYMGIGIPLFAYISWRIRIAC